MTQVLCRSAVAPGADNSFLAAGAALLGTLLADEALSDYETEVLWLGLYRQPVGARVESSEPAGLRPEALCWRA